MTIALVSATPTPIACRSGTKYTPTAAGVINVQPADLHDAIGMGYLPISAEGSTLAPAADGITAFATGGQASATPLTALVNRVSTVATAADSVLLPASAAGMEVVVTNDGAAAMQVFGTGTDTVNSIAFGTGFSHPAGSTLLYSCAANGAWTVRTDLADAQFKTTSASGAAVAAADMTGSRFCALKCTANGANALATRSAAQIIADLPAQVAKVGKSWVVRIISAGDNTVTLTAGANVTVTGTATAATGKWRDFLVTIATASTVVFQDIGGN